MQRINEDIKTGKLKQIYLLYGEERYLRRQYRDRLKNALCDEGDTMNTHFYEGKNIPVEEIIDLAETLPFFADRRVIFIENSGLFKAGGEKLAEYLNGLNESACFVFNESEVDKRSRLFKTVQAKGYAADFTVQDEGTLMRWIAGILKREGMQITAATARLFLSKTGNDMDNIYMELEKLICYCMGRSAVTDADVEAICTSRISSHIFEMINAIADGQNRRALSLYYELLALREAPMRILILLARQYNMLLQVKSLKSKGFDNRSIAERAGLSSYVVGKYITQAARFRISELKEAVERCVEAEEAIKTGKMGDMLSLELLIVSAQAASGESRS